MFLCEEDLPRKENLGNTRPFIGITQVRNIHQVPFRLVIGQILELMVTSTIVDVSYQSRSVVNLMVLERNLSN